MMVTGSESASGSGLSARRPNRPAPILNWALRIVPQDHSTASLMCTVENRSKNSVAGERPPPNELTERDPSSLGVGSTVESQGLSGDEGAKVRRRQTYAKRLRSFLLGCEASALRYLELMLDAVVGWDVFGSSS